MIANTTPTVSPAFADRMATAKLADDAAARHLATARAALERGDLQTAEAALVRAQSANNAAKAWIQQARETLR